MAKEVSTFRILGVNRSASTLLVLLLRWSIDISELTGLELTGDSSLAVPLNADEEKKLTILQKKGYKAALRQQNTGSKQTSSKVTYAGWIKYCYGEKQNGSDGSEFRPSLIHKHEDNFATYLAVLLSRMILPSLPEEGPSDKLFPLAAWLSRGVAIPIGPLVLRSLYTQLNKIQFEMRHSVGRYDIKCFASPITLQMFLCEHFPDFASPKHSLPVRYHKLLAPRAERWHMCPTPKGSLTEFIDDESAFVQCPYAKVLEYVSRQLVFPYQDRLFDLEVNPSGEGNLSLVEAAFVFTPWYLPSITECGI